MRNYFESHSLMTKHFALASMAILILYSCGKTQDQLVEVVYARIVGETKFDPTQDDPAFKPCNEQRVAQYYNFGNGFQYKGEKSEINKIFKENFKHTEQQGETGYVTIRFMVNCKGQSGWFRIQEMDVDYNPKIFSKTSVDALLKITKGLDGWVVGEMDNESFDYYQYLTFKMENGVLIEIMP
jgi:hypothetical protein